MVQFRVLGPLEVVGAEGVLALGSTQQRLVLALLLVHSPEPVSVDWLIDQIWGERPPPSAEHAVRVYVSGIRKLLRAGGTEIPVRTSPSGYAIDVEPEQVDARRFQRLIDEAQRALAENPPHARGLFEEALGLWRGPPLAEFEQSELARSESDRLEELRTLALEGVVEARLACGEHGETIGQLTGLVAANPLRERPRRLLMLALYRSGRHAEALAAYRDACGALDEIGLQPGPELRQLEEAILRHDASLAAPSAAEVPIAGSAQSMVAAVSSRPEAPVSGAVWERVVSGGTGTVTLLFTDLVGSTELLDRLGDDAADRLRDDHFRVLRDAVREHRGEEVKSLGDGLMVAFGSAFDGLACAAAMQRRIAEDHERLGAESLGLRVGLNAGEVMRAEDDYFGAPVVVAKRLCDRAEPAQTLVSGILRALVGSRGGYRLLDLGMLSLKGFADPVKAFELDWRAAASEGKPGLAELPLGERLIPEQAEERVELPGALLSEARSEMVGRAPQLEALAQEWRRTCKGELRIVLVGGEPGIGKTRLAAEFARRVYEDGAVVLFGRSDPEPLPFGPFVEALSGFVRQLSTERLRSVVGENASVLARMLPELAGRLPGVAQIRSGDPESERYRLFEAIASLLRALCERQAVVLVLDDVHWADKPTLALLRALVRSLTEGRLLILGTYRDLEVGRGHPLRELIAERHRSAPLSLIGLEGLSREEVEALVAAWAGQRAPVELTSLLWEETEGHPFFVQEVLRHLLETGAIYERRGQLRTAGSLERLGVPTSVKEVIEQRLARLDDEALELLRVAAVVGREFDAGLVEQLLPSLAGDRMFRLLDDATAARVIAPAPGSFERYRFSHALIRETLHAGLSPAWRVRLHQRTAEALERLDAEERARHLGELSRHYFEAAAASEALGKAIEYAIAAGDQAVAQLAYEEASEHYERALRALELGRGDARRSCDVLLALGDSRWAAGEIGLSREVFARAAALAERERLPEQLAAAALGFGGRIAFQVNVIDVHLIALLERALELLDSGDSSLRARVLARLCEALTLRAPLERRQALAEEALAIVRRLGDDEVLAYVLLRTWWGTHTPNNLEQRLTVSRHVVDVASQLGGQVLLIEALCWLGSSLAELGDIAQVREISERIETLVAQAPQPYLQWLLSNIQAILAMLDRPTDELERRVWATFDLGQAPQNSSAMAALGGHMIYLRWLQGRMPEMHASTTAMADYFDYPAYHAALGWVCAEIGLEHDARREFERFAANDFAGFPRDIFWFTGMAMLVFTSHHLRDRKRAAALYELLAPYGERVVIVSASSVSLGCVHAFLGILASVMERYELAEQHFEQAARRNREVGAAHMIAVADFYEADMLVRRGGPGDSERAQELIDHALEHTRAARLDGITGKLIAVRERIVGTAPSESARARRRRVGAGAKAAVTTRGREALARLVSGRSDEELQRHFGSAVAQRALFTAMAQGFQPRMAFGFAGAIQIELQTRGIDAEHRAPNPWTLHVAGRKASAHHEPAANPSVSIRTDMPTFMRIFTGELNPVTAYMDRQVEIVGDVMLGPRLVEMFGGVKPFKVVEAA